MDSGNNFESKIKELKNCFPNPTPETHKKQSTKEGLQAIKDGQFIYKNKANRVIDFNLVLKQLGGYEGLFTLFGCHYRRLFSDPRMVVLFNINDEDSKVSAYEHGTRIASVIIGQQIGDHEAYNKLKRGNRFQNIQNSHIRAKKCPFRQPELKNKNFTQTQRNAWLGHVWASCDEMGLSKPIKELFTFHLGVIINFYNPFQKI